MKKILFAIAALAMTLTASASDALKVTMSLDKALVAGGTATMTCYESDTDAYTLVQMNIALPEGLSYVLNGDDEIVTGTDRWHRNHSCSLNEKTGVLLLDNSKNKDFLTNEGDLFTITLKASDTFTKGDIKITMIQCVKSDATGSYAADIVLSTESTGVQTVDADVDANEPTKYVENGQVVISKNNKKYTSAGAQIK